MALRIYGSPHSRTLRVLWMAAELGLDYELIPLAWDDPALKDAAYLAINPAGRVPAIDDDGFLLSESLAINLYLAKKAGSPLYPATVQGEALTWAWTLWATYELESFLNKDLRRPRLDEATVAGSVAGALEHLERALTASRFLLGDAFGVADLNVACALSPSRSGRLDLEPYPAVRSWLERCRSRPAWAEARRIHEASS